MIGDAAKKLLEELQRHIPQMGLLPKQEIQVILQAALAKLDLVTREEFDAQSAVLQRTRQKLEHLEAQIKALEDC